MVLNSMAGTDAKYIPLQARLYPDGKLHIQGKGTETNRPYGVAEDVAIPCELFEFFKSQHNTLKSLAGTPRRYMPIQARVREPGKVHVQVADGTGNRPYGMSFDLVKCDQVTKFVQAEAKRIEAEAAAKAVAEAKAAAEKAAKESAAKAAAAELAKKKAAFTSGPHAVLCD